MSSVYLSVDYIQQQCCPLIVSSFWVGGKSSQFQAQKPQTNHLQLQLRQPHSIELAGFPDLRSIRRSEISRQPNYGTLGEISLFAQCKG